MSLAAGGALALAGAPLCFACLYLLVLAVASFRRPAEGNAMPDHDRCLVVLVPAHDEQELIGRCVRSLLEQDYPRHLYRIVVIADNCTDATAALAREAGAEVIERTDPARRGKGQALRWAMDGWLAGAEPADGFVIIDADSVVESQLLSSMGAALKRGVEVAQADYSVLPEPSAKAQLVAAGFLLFHRVRFGGRAALGLPACLVGNGMLLGRGLVETHPWDAFSGVEDLEYGLNLRVAGFRPAYLPGARVAGPVPTGYGGMTGQRVRWEGGRFNLVRTRLPGLARRVAAGRLGLLDAAIDLAVPPLSILSLLAAAGTAAAGLLAAGGWVPLPALGPWLLADFALAGFVLLGLRSAGAPPALYRALAVELPRFLAWKLLTYARLSRFDPTLWERSRRDGGPAGAGDGSRVELAGVPIDRLSRADAVSRLAGCLGLGRLVQVTTVNLDFLVRARTRADVREVLRAADLSLADGAPVVWLSRLLGRPVPERVAGADLVPDLVRAAAAAGARVFLLGGEDGSAEAAAGRLVAMNPGLQIAGWHEPPRSNLEQMDETAITALIREAGSDVLLVALGHPKQDLFITRNRERLEGVSVAIGVGCVFDILAGRLGRAPAWMQRSGTEWLYRLLNEPGKLARRYAQDAGWLPVLAGQVLVMRIRTALS